MKWDCASNISQVVLRPAPLPLFLLRFNRKAMNPLTQESPETLQQRKPRFRWLGWSSFIFIFLQSACTFVLATSGIRVFIGLSSLAAAAGTNAPAKGFHQDAIRIPMMIFALVGTCHQSLRSMARAQSAQAAGIAMARSASYPETETIRVAADRAFDLDADPSGRRGWTHQLLHHPPH